jgi:adenosylcobinamide-phosphate guanylyltransferase
MDAVIMCGGRGTRLDAAVEKPLFEIGGVAMIDRVHRAFENSGIETVTAAVSPQAPETRSHLASRDQISLVETPGDGYVEDLGVALEAVDLPVMTIVSDLPLIEADLVDRVLETAADVPGPITVDVPVALKRELGASIDIERDGMSPTGCNLVTARTETTATETMYTSYDARLAVNVNRRSDARLAEALLCE